MHEPSVPKLQRSSLYGMILHILMFIVSCSYITWVILALLKGRFSLVLHANRKLPVLITKLPERYVIGVFYRVAQCTLYFWKILYVLRYGIGIGSPVTLIVYFFSRIYQGYYVDVLYLPALFVLTVLFHEVGHALMYAKFKYPIVDIQVGLPLYGRTVAIQTRAMQPSERALIGIGGCSMNAVVVLLIALSLIECQSSIQIYLLATNLCFVANCLFPITKDYAEVKSISH